MLHLKDLVKKYQTLYEDWNVVSVDWKWFPCNQTKKCIHFNNRCDSIPHPDCIYENENGFMIAEDEEYCSLRKSFLSLKSVFIRL